MSHQLIVFVDHPISTNLLSADRLKSADRFASAILTSADRLTSANSLALAVVIQEHNGSDKTGFLSLFSTGFDP